MLPEHDIQKSVLQKIRGGGVSMHSRAYFVLRMFLAGIIALLILASAFFVLSFAFFSVHQSGVQFLLEFGEQGLVTFVTLFPWAALLLFVLLLVALEFLVRRYTAAYRFSLLRLFLWVAAVGIVGSVLVGFTPLHSFLLSEADNDQLPILGAFYEQLHDSHTDRGVYRGAVTAIVGQAFVISHNDNDRDSDEGTWTIMPPAGFDPVTLAVGENVYVAGTLMNGIVYAYGIQIVPDGE